MKGKRIICSVLAMSMISTNCVFADQILSSKKVYTNAAQSVVVGDNGQVIYPDLTIDEATQKAIAYSPALKTIAENKEETDNSNESLTFSFHYSYDDGTVASTELNQQVAYNIRALNNALRSLDANDQIAKEGLRVSVEGLFNTIKAAQDDIALYEKDMVIQEKNIKIAEVKKNLGLMSQLEYDNTVNTYNTTVAEKQTLEITVDSAFRSLNDVMGTDLNLKYNIVLDDVEYTPLGDVNLQTSINKALLTKESIKAKKDAVDLAYYDYKTYIPISTETGQNEKKRNAYNQAQRDYETEQTNVRTNMTNLYDNIITAEKTYKDTKGSLDVLKSQYEVIKTQYELGKATEVELLTVEYNIAKAEAGIDKLVRGHKLMVEQFNNPDLIQ